MVDGEITGTDPDAVELALLERTVHADGPERGAFDLTGGGLDAQTGRRKLVIRIATAGGHGDATIESLPLDRAGRELTHAIGRRRGDIGHAGAVHAHAVVDHQGLALAEQLASHLLRPPLGDARHGADAQQRLAGGERVIDPMIEDQRERLVLFRVVERHLAGRLRGQIALLVIGQRPVDVLRLHDARVIDDRAHALFGHSPGDHRRGGGASGADHEHHGNDLAGRFHEPSFGCSSVGRAGQRWSAATAGGLAARAATPPSVHAVSRRCEARSRQQQQRQSCGAEYRAICARVHKSPLPLHASASRASAPPLYMLTCDDAADNACPALLARLPQVRMSQAHTRHRGQRARGSTESRAAATPATTAAPP